MFWCSILHILSACFSSAQQHPCNPKIIYQPSGSKLVSSALTSSFFIFISAADNQSLCTAYDDPQTGNLGPGQCVPIPFINSVFVSPDGWSVLAVVSWRAIQTWDIGADGALSNARSYPIPGPYADSTGLAISSDGAYVLVFYEVPFTLLPGFWIYPRNVDTGELGEPTAYPVSNQTVDTGEPTAYSLSITEDGRTLLHAGMNNVYTYDRDPQSSSITNQRKYHVSASDLGITQIGATADGTMVIAALDSSLWVWSRDLDSGELSDLTQYTPPDCEELYCAISKFTITSDGNYVITFGWDRYTDEPGVFTWQVDSSGQLNFVSKISVGLSDSTPVGVHTRPDDQRILVVMDQQVQSLGMCSPTLSPTIMAPTPADEPADLSILWIALSATAAMLVVCLICYCTLRTKSPQSVALLGVVNDPDASPYDGFGEFAGVKFTNIDCMAAFSASLFVTMQDNVLNTRFQELKRRQVLLALLNPQFSVIVFVSHPWVSKELPDPEGTQRARLLEILSLAFRLDPLIMCAEQLVQPEGRYSLLAWARHCRSHNMTFEDFLSTVGVWYDYACMPQVPRLGAEANLFESMIGCLDDVLAVSTVIALDDVPVNQFPYMMRAWCVAELRLAQCYSIALIVSGHIQPAFEAPYEHPDSVIEGLRLQFLRNELHVTNRGDIAKIFCVALKADVRHNATVENVAVTYLAFPAFACVATFMDQLSSAFNPLDMTQYYYFWPLVAILAPILIIVVRESLLQQAIEGGKPSVCGGRRTARCLCMVDLKGTDRLLPAHRRLWIFRVANWMSSRYGYVDSRINVAALASPSPLFFGALSAGLLVELIPPPPTIITSYYAFLLLNIANALIGLFSLVKMGITMRMVTRSIKQMSCQGV